MKENVQSIVNRLIKYFFRGLLFTAPIFVTLYIIIAALQFIDGILKIEIPGIGFAIVIGSITLLGSLASTVLAKPILDLMVNIMENIPIVNSLYTSLKDLVDAFVGDNKKFQNPVLVCLDAEKKIKRLGFITERNLTGFGVDATEVAVYVPDSYGFTGNLFIVHIDMVQTVDIPVADVMKFIISGGITKI